MNFWTRRRGRQLVALILMTTVLVLVGALVAYADSTDSCPSVASPAQAPRPFGWDGQGDATPTATMVVPPTDSPTSEQGAVPAVVGGTEVATPTATAAPPPAPTPTPAPISPTNVIVNGGFEEGFLEWQGVGVGWGRFHNGSAHAGWYDDTWFKVVYEGEHAQLLELKNATEGNRYVGIFQTVSVVPNAEYVLTLHGLVRSDEGSIEASNYGYRLHYGIDFKGGTDWESSDITWVELPWDDQPREDPTGGNEYRIETYTTNIKAETDKLTLFIRGWKKWADPREGNYDIDGVSLVGPSSSEGGGEVQPTATSVPATPVPEEMPETGVDSVFLENPVFVVATVALLVVLAGGAVWGMSRRRI
jgi:hypothetical protein